MIIPLRISFELVQKPPQMGMKMLSLDFYLFYLYF